MTATLNPSPTIAAGTAVRLPCGCAGIAGPSYARITAVHLNAVCGQDRCTVDGATVGCLAHPATAELIALEVSR